MNTTTSTYTHIIWDWNGTLMDDAWLCIQVMNEMLSRRGLPTVTPQQHAELFDFPVSEYYQQIGWDLLMNPYEMLSDEFTTEYTRRLTECPLREGTIETLSRVTQSGLTQSVLSAARQSLVNQMVAHYKVAEHFESLHGLHNNHAASKVDIAKKWLAQSGRDPGCMLMVGDTTHDYHVAQELNADCVLVFSGHMSHTRLQATGARVVDTLDQIEF